ncbi:permease-like cell division protein FtsX [Aestuariicella sp. G3-2]|uniref:permease-like cell division protein FtsX n=1 Tax=Pseudomaricurvus albidus TaxID=2842452 RepID=UPI001C0AC9DB|nr:permease-like cell division protein FtsX [Aestuariicella albida]MBU3068754.1 permease-like cell division protein FtsX [Aestuariicella albida]
MQRTQKRSNSRVAPAAAGASRGAAKPGGKNVRGGAKVYKTGWKDRWQGYLAHHQSSARDSLQRMLAAPVQSLMTWLVIAVALALPATLLVCLDNIQSLGQRWDGAPQITLFLNPRATERAIADLQRRLESRDDIDTVAYVSAADALKEFETESGMGNALRSLDTNPLPPTLLLTPSTDAAPAALSALGDSLGQQGLVDDVVFDRAWIERLHQILELGEQLAIALGGLLALGVLLVIGNTIRLSIESRRDEIVIVKLVGGTDAFVRRPFLYTGLWYGLGGGVLAMVLLSLLLLLLSGPVAMLADSYQSDFHLQGLGFGGGLLLIVSGALVGWLGAWLAVGRHLGDIEPQ